MEELRDTFKAKQEFEFDHKRELFYDIFQSRNQSPSEILQEGNAWFLNEIPYLEKQDNAHVLVQIFNQSKTTCYGDLTVDGFISDLIESIKQLHFQVCERDLNVTNIHKSIKILEEFYEQFTNNPESIKIPDKENALYISYVKEKNFSSDIFKFYKIKYKAATIHQNFSSIYSEEDNHLCNLVLNGLIETVYIHVLGKKLQSANPNEHFNIISKIELPILEVFTSIKPKYFKLDVMPASYLILPYKDQSSDAVYKSENNVEMKFEVKLNKDERLKVIKKLIDYYKNLVIDLEHGIKKRLSLIDEILFPFRQKIVYEKGKGLFPKGKGEKGRSCDSICKIF